MPHPASRAPATIPLQPGWAYGPVASRRFGRSLGVNLLPLGRKLCNFDCVYCQYDATPADGEGALPSRSEVTGAVEAALRAAACDSITIAGNGEPTLHPAFGEVAHDLAALRDRHAPAARLLLLTNGTRLARPDVRDALGAIDRAYVKLDAGDEATLRAVARPRGASLAGVVRLLEAFPGPFAVQAMFMLGAHDNAAPAAVERWLELVVGLRPVEVHVTTIDRGTAVPGLLPVPAARLERIAEAVRERGVAARAFPCSDASAWSPGGLP